MCHFLLLPGVTNYLHLIGAGHLLYYLKQYGNLYRLSQQGWEALNKLIKSHYHSKSNHGGCLGTKSGDMVRGKHLLPTANLITRRLCWLTRIGQEYFEGLEHCQPCTVEQPEEEELEEPEPEEEETVPTETTGLRAFLVANGMPMEPL